MLVELEIKDFALVEQVRVPFAWGLNVLTGETGAGKSIIMDALNAVLGGKVGPSVIRPQAERAIVEASFKLTPALMAWLKQQELQDDDSEVLVISREILKTGSKIRVNGSLVNLALMQELRQKLVTVHAQHESRTLLSPQSQLEMLDALGDDAQRKLLNKVRTLYARRKDMESQLKDMLISEEERERRLDFARFQHNELVEASLEDANEDELLSTKRRALSNVAELEALLANVQKYLRGNDSDTDGLVDLGQNALVDLWKAADLDATLTSLGQSLSDSLDQIEEGSREIRRYCDLLDGDPQALSDLDERLAQLATIKRKYGNSLSVAIERKNELSEEISKLENSQAVTDQLKSELAATESELEDFARQLSAKRKTLAQKLAKRIQAELVELGMENCHFEIDFMKNDNEQSASQNESARLSVGPSGADRVDFLIAPNPGQPPQPVAKIASGGELSRVMLAIKSIFAGADGVATVIFDEIDTGLSGRVLQSVRDKLARLAEAHQILCITHQPIIASVADNHIFVAKEQSKNSTKTTVSILDSEARLKAVAGMASGQENQDAALKFAKALLDESSRLKLR